MSAPQYQTIRLLLLNHLPAVVQSSSKVAKLCIGSSSVVKNSYGSACIPADCLRVLTLVGIERVVMKFVPWRSTEGQLHTVSGDRGLDHAYAAPIMSLHEDPEPYSAALEA